MITGWGQDGRARDRAERGARPSIFALALALTLAWGPARADDVDAGPGAKHVVTMTQIRDAQVVRQHWDLTCGAAAIATLLTYQLGDPVTERQAALGMLHQTNPLLVRARLGFSLLDLKRFAASRGLSAAGYGGLSLDDLTALAPVIAPIRVRGFGHFVVVRARLGDRLLLADPAFGNRVMSEAEFRKAWTSGVGFVVFRPGEPHAPNRMGAPALLPRPNGAALRAVEADLRAPGGRS